MCFILYIATSQPVPEIPWRKEARAFNTRPLTDGDTEVPGHFTLPYVTCIGSDQGCGCGFRNVSYQDGSWPEEAWWLENPERETESQINHEQLVKFARRHLPLGESFELYGAWNGDFEESAASDQKIGIEKILDPDFFFRERGRYTVNLS